MARLIDFDRDDAAQRLLERHACIDGPYEAVIERTSLELLRRKAPQCVIESIRFVRSAGSHPDFRAGGTQVPSNPDQIVLQELTLPFDLEIAVSSGTSRQLLQATFVFECTRLDDAPRVQFHLGIRSQRRADSGAADATA